MDKKASEHLCKMHPFWAVADPKEDNALIEAMKDLFQKHSNRKPSREDCPKLFSCGIAAHFKRNIDTRIMCKAEIIGHFKRHCKGLPKVDYKPKGGGQTLEKNKEASLYPSTNIKS